MMEVDARDGLGGRGGGLPEAAAVKIWVNSKMFSNLFEYTKSQSILGIRRSSFSSRKHLYNASILCNLRLFEQLFFSVRPFCRISRNIKTCIS